MTRGGSQLGSMAPIEASAPTHVVDAVRAHYERCVQRPMPVQSVLFELMALGLVAFAGMIGGCAAESPPRGLEETCIKACTVQASHCSPHECGRGCNFVLDRLAEKEGGRVIACVAAATRGCDDGIWAGCAVRIGPHADGGPPAPPGPPGQDDRAE